MHFRFTKGQLDKLSDLFIDIAKGWFLASIGAPILSPSLTFINSLSNIAIGLAFVYLTLQVELIKEKQ